jgi:hypothetical protein
VLRWPRGETHGPRGRQAGAQRACERMARRHAHGTAAGASGCVMHGLSSSARPWALCQLSGDGNGSVHAGAVG